MNLNKKKLFKIFKRKNIEYLYHANSVVNSCHFLNHGSLLSREKVEKLNLPQTEQSSDSKDKKFKIFNDIFVDSCDIHKRGNKKNHYGPIVFKISIDILKDDCVNEVWITKNNPINWKDIESEESLWFQNLDEIKIDFDEFSFAQILVFRECNGVIQLKNYIKEILIDDPKKSFSSIIDLYSYTKGGLMYAYNIGPLYNITFKRRKCSLACECLKEYSNYGNVNLKKYFSPLSGIL